MIHMLKERKGPQFTTKCGKVVTVSYATIWHTDVTCPACDRLVHPPKKRILRRRGRR